MITVKQLYDEKKKLLSYSPDYIVGLCKKKDPNYNIKVNSYDRTFSVENTSILDESISNILNIKSSLVYTALVISNNNIIIGI